MNYPFESYEQFCLKQKKNVIIEEHFLPSGKHHLICQNESFCKSRECVLIKRLIQQMNKMKTFEK